MQKLLSKQWFRRLMWQLFRAQWLIDAEYDVKITSSGVTARVTSTRWVRFNPKKS